MAWGRNNKKNQQTEAVVEESATGVGWTQGTALRTGAVTAALWLLVGCGPAALVWGVLNRPATVTAAAATVSVDPQQVRDQRRAEEYAVRIVTVWLSAHRGQEDLVQALLPQLSAAALPAQGLSVTDPMVADSTLGADSVWSVTVAAQVGDIRMVARRFFTVPVRVSGDAVVVVGLPSERPGSQVVAAAPQLDYDVDVPASAPLSEGVAAFLGAVLAGQGDVERLVSPTAQIRAVVPAPFAAVQVVRIVAHGEVPESPAEGARLDVLVTAIAQVVAPNSSSEAAKQQVAVQYPLTLTVRAGRWEISAIRDSPLLKAPSSVAASTIPAPAGTPTPSSLSSSGSASPTRK